MSQSLFPNYQIDTDFIFQISYEGSSFDGQINLSNLAEEISGFSYCLNLILSNARREGIIDIILSDYEFVVEPFQKGSFRKKIKLVAKSIEKYPATTNTALTIALIFVGIGQLIISANANNLSSSSQNISQTIIDKIKLDLLTDKEFLRAYSKIVTPLNNEDDKIKLIKPDNTNYEINYSEKKNFEELAEDDFEFIKEVPETLTGRVTRVDLTATKNALGFKVNDSGSTIPASFLDSISIDERKSLLDQTIEITGITSKSDTERKHVVIYSYKIVTKPELLTLPFIERE